MARFGYAYRTKVDGENVEGRVGGTLEDTTQSAYNESAP